MRERWESWIIAHEHQPKLEQRVFCSVPPLPALNYLFKWEHWEIRGGVGGQLVKHAFKFFRCLKKTFKSPLQQVFTGRMVFIAQVHIKKHTADRQSNGPNSSALTVMISLLFSSGQCKRVVQWDKKKHDLHDFLMKNHLVTYLYQYTWIMLLYH